jgi:hypothetical protein
VPSEVGQSLPKIDNGFSSELRKILGIKCVAPSCLIFSHLPSAFFNAPPTLKNLKLIADIP